MTAIEVVTLGTVPKDQEKRLTETERVNLRGVMFWPFYPAKNAIQGNAPEGSATL